MVFLSRRQDVLQAANYFVFFLGADFLAFGGGALGLLGRLTAALMTAFFFRLACVLEATDLASFFSSDTIMRSLVLASLRTSFSIRFFPALLAESIFANAVSTFFRYATAALWAALASFISVFKDLNAADATVFAAEAFTLAFFLAADGFFLAAAFLAAKSEVAFVRFILALFNLAVVFSRFLAALVTCFSAVAFSKTSGVFIVMENSPVLKIGRTQYVPCFNFDQCLFPYIVEIYLSTHKIWSDEI